MSQLLQEASDVDSSVTIELPDVALDEGLLLMEVVYKGSVEATMAELRSLILLARFLRISIPVSQDLLHTLNVEPEPPPEPALETERVTWMTNNDDEESDLVAKAKPVTNMTMPLPPPLKRIKRGERAQFYVSCGEKRTLGLSVRPAFPPRQPDRVCTTVGVGASPPFMQEGCVKLT